MIHGRLAEKTKIILQPQGVYQINLPAIFDLVTIKPLTSGSIRPVVGLWLCSSCSVDGVTLLQPVLTWNFEVKAHNFRGFDVVFVCFALRGGWEQNCAVNM